MTTEMSEQRLQEIKEDVERGRKYDVPDDWDCNCESLYDVMEELVTAYETSQAEVERLRALPHDEIILLEDKLDNVKENKMEKILKIEDLELDGDSWCSQAGYKVTTTDQEIVLVIDNEQSCCETFGYFWCNEKPQDFIGAELWGISLTDTELDAVFMDESAQNMYEGGIMFVNLDTSKGVLQFVAYNAHNGYYGHQAVVKSTQLEHSETL